MERTAGGFEISGRRSTLSCGVNGSGSTWFQEGFRLTFFVAVVLKVDVFCRGYFLLCGFCVSCFVFRDPGFGSGSTMLLGKTERMRCKVKVYGYGVLGFRFRVSGFRVLVFGSGSTMLHRECREDQPSKWEQSMFLGTPDLTRGCRIPATSSANQED